MDLFAERGFIERFEKDNNPEKYTYIQQIISTIFSRYANIRLFTDASFSFVEESELLTKLSDTNTDFIFELDFEVYFIDKIPASQTIILTEEPRPWFLHMKSQGALCYSYDSYENEIREFIKDTHIDVSLTDSRICPFNWSIFQYIQKYETFIIITDPYVLNENSNQKINDNLGALLKKNLDKEREYKIFIIADVTGFDKERITQKVELIYQYLDDYQVIIYLINNFRGVENMRIHDRYLFTNHVIVNCGIGFNLNLKNRELSEIKGKSIFDYTTYRKFGTHFKFLRDYLSKIEGLEVQVYKTNDSGSFKSFFEIANCISP